MDWPRLHLPALPGSAPPSAGLSGPGQTFVYISSGHTVARTQLDPRRNQTQISARDTVSGCPWVGHSQSLIVFGKVGNSIQLILQNERWKDALSWKSPPQTCLRKAAGEMLRHPPGLLHTQRRPQGLVTRAAYWDSARGVTWNKSWNCPVPQFPYP